MKPKLLDLFCGAGGAAQGYSDAGFDVVGVDHIQQPNYPFKFILADVLDVLRDVSLLQSFDVVHASPPCQAHSPLAAIWRARLGIDVWARKHPDLIPQTREGLKASGQLYVIENVSPKPLRNAILLCGTFFDLKVYRHRYFEMPLFVLSPKHIPHKDNCPVVGRGKSRKGFISVTGHGGFGFPGGWEYAQKAMGINWMSRKELSQAIPPAYTHWIGIQILKKVNL